MLAMCNGFLFLLKPLKKGDCSGQLLKSCYVPGTRTQNMCRRRYRNVLYDREGEYAHEPFRICLSVTWMEAHHPALK